MSMELVQLPPHLIEVHVPSQECKRSYIYVRGVDLLLSKISYGILELFLQCGIFFVFHFSFIARSDEMYSIQRYIIKCVSNLRQVGVFLKVLRFSPINKTERHDITEILLKVPLNTTTLNPEA